MRGKGRAARYGAPRIPKPGANMSLDIIIIMLVAACLHASWNVVIKGGTNTLYETGINTLGGGAGVVFILPFLPLPDAGSWPFLCVSMTFHLAYYLCMAAAYRQSEMSYAYTLMRGSTPLFTAVGMAFLGQHISIAGWFGIVCLCAGVLTLASQNLRNGTFNKQGTVAALGTAVVIMGYTLVDGFGVRTGSNAISYACWLYFFNMFPLNVLILRRRGRDYTDYIRRRWKIGLFGGLCSLGSYGVALWAMTRAPIQLVAALRETSVIFGMLLAVLFLGERLTRTRILAVLLVAAGTVIMRLA